MRMYNTPAQPTRNASSPMEFALTFPGVTGGYMIAPRGPFGVRGHPTTRRGASLSRDPEFAARVWQFLQDVSGVTSAL